MAVGTYEVYTYGGGEMLWEVFNAAAAYTGGGDYLTLIRLFGVLALFWVIIELGVRKTLNWQWFAMFMLMYTVFFVPRANVKIVDKLDPAAVRVVANVPWGMAAPAWLFSFLGTEIAGALESLMSVPGDLRYTKHGMVFGSRLMAELDEARFEDPLLRRNLMEYMKQCVFWNIAYGFYSFRDLYYSRDLFNLIFSTTKNSAIRGMFYLGPNGASSFMTCVDAARQLRTDVRNEANNRLIPEWAARIFGHETRDPMQQKAMLLSALPAGFAFFTGASHGAMQLLMQAAIGNYVRGAYGPIAAAMGADGMAAAYASEVAKRQQRSSWATMGLLVGRTLELMRQVFEALIYSLFIFAFLAMLLPAPASVKALTTWLKMLVWINLWPSLYAMLNLAASLYGKVSFGISPAESMAGLDALARMHADVAVMAGYLAASIPILSWSLVSMSGQVMGMMSERLMAPGMSAATQAAAEAARGNISAGNATLGTASWMQEQTAPNTNLRAMWSDGSGMVQAGLFGSGWTATRAISDLGTRVATTDRVLHGISAARERELALARQHEAAYIRSAAMESQHAHSFMERALHSEDASLRKAVQDIVGDGKSFKTGYDVLHQYGHERGISDEVMTALAMAARAGIRFDSEDQLLGWLAAKGIGASMWGEVSAEGKGQAASRFMEAYRELTQGHLKQEYDEAVRQERQLADLAEKHTSDGAAREAAEGFTDSFRRSEQEMEQWRESVQRADRLRNMEQFMHEQGREVQSNLGQEFRNFLLTKGVDVEHASQADLAKWAESAEFAEFLVARGFGRERVDAGYGMRWAKGQQQELTEQGDRVGDGMPHVHDRTGEGTTASKTHNAGMTPGVLGGATADQVSRKLDEAEKWASEDKKKLHDGEAETKAGVRKMQQEVGSQPIDTTKRAVGKAAEALKNTVGDLFKEVVHATGGLDVTGGPPKGTPLHETPGAREEEGRLTARPRTLGNPDGEIKWTRNPKAGEYGWLPGVTRYDETVPTPAELGAEPPRGPGSTWLNKPAWWPETKEESEELLALYRSRNQMSPEEWEQRLETWKQEMIKKHGSN